MNFLLSGSLISKFLCIKKKLIDGHKSYSTLIFKFFKRKYYIFKNYESQDLINVFFF